MKNFYRIGYMSLLASVAGFNFGENPSAPSIVAIQPHIGPTHIADWYGIFQDIVGWIFTIAIVLGVAILIIAGIMYITSAGGDRAKTAQKMVIYAVVGIAIAGLAWAIVNLVGNFFVGTHLVLP